MSRRFVQMSVAAALCGCAFTAAAHQQTKPAPKQKAPAASERRAKAEETYRTTCQPCHGPAGAAPLKEMNLADSEWKHGSTPAAIAKTIQDGVPGTAMLGFKDKFSAAEIQQLAALVATFGKPAPAKKK